MTPRTTPAEVPANRPTGGPPADGPGRPLVRGMIVVVAILLPQVILYWPSLAGGKIALPVDLLYPLYSDPTKPPANLNEALWDPIAHNEPCRRFIADELRAGRLPLWNPYIFCGAPLFTNAWSLFQWPYYAWPDPAILAWTALLKALVTGGGAYLFFRQVARVSFWPAVFGSAAYPLTMFFVLWQYYMLSSACAWLPWLLLFTDATVRRPGGFGPVGVALITAAIFAEGLGAPWPHLLLASGLFALFTLVDRCRGVGHHSFGKSAELEGTFPPSPLAGEGPGMGGKTSIDIQNHPHPQPLSHRERGEQESFAFRWFGENGLISAGSVKAVFALVFAWGIGGGLMTIQNLPALEYLRTSHRVAARSEGTIEQPPAGLRAWTEWLFPYHSGDMTSSSFYLPQKGNQLEGAASASSGLLIALVLAPFAFCDPRNRWRNFFWLALGLFGMAFQADIPFVSELFRVFPFKVLRNNRFTFYTGWAAVALAVNGLQVLWSGQRRWRHVFWVPVLAIVAVGLQTMLDRTEVPALLRTQGRQLAIEWFQRVYAWELGVCATALVAWWLARHRRLRGAGIAFVLAALATGELIYNAWGFNPQCDRAHYYPATPITDALRSAPPGRVAMARYLRPNAAMMYGLSEVRGYDGADPLRLVKLYRVVDREWPWVSLHAVTSTFDPPKSPMMDMLNLRYVFHAGFPPSRENVVAEDPNGWLEEHADALPRAYVPRRVATVGSDEECLELLQKPDFNAREVAYVTGATTLAAETNAQGTAELKIDESQRVVVAANMQTSGFLVLADSWNEGWQAFVDGQLAPVVRVNSVIRGVALSAGEHSVEFRYAPASAMWGLRISAGCLMALSLWYIATYRAQSSEAFDH